MINILALALLVSSLAAAGVWSPPPPRSADPHLIREGHRLIVVEYERHVPSKTPPPPQTTTIATHDIIEEAEEKFQEASSLLPNLGQGISTPESTAAVERPAHSAKDLICDAYGSCKEKISDVFHKGKDKIARKGSDVRESAKEAAETVKKRASDIKEGMSESAKEAVETAKERASDIKEGMKDSVRSTIEKASQIEERAKDAVKSTVRNVAEVTMDGGEDAVRNISTDAGQVVDGAEEAANLPHRNLTDILNRARDVAFDAAKYVGAPETGRAVAQTAHLLGFAVAYGTCVWVTFVSSHVLATALPRQQFGMLQSKLYPVYFQVVAYAVGIACLGHFFAKKRVVGVERVQGYNLLAALGLVLVNMFYLEPKATKVMFERMKMEKEEGRGRDMADVLGEPVMTAAATATTTTATTQSATTIGVTRTSVAVDHEAAVKSRVAKLNKKLRKLNTYSSFLNMLTLMSLTWHLVNLAQRLQRTC